MRGLEAGTRTGIEVAARTAGERDSRRHLTATYSEAVPANLGSAARAVVSGLEAGIDDEVVSVGVSLRVARCSAGDEPHHGRARAAHLESREVCSWGSEDSRSTTTVQAERLASDPNLGAKLECPEGTYKTTGSQRSSRSRPLFDARLGNRLRPGHLPIPR